MLAINIKPKAEDDLEDIFIYSLNNFGWQRAEEYISTLDNAFAQLAESPRLGKRQENLSKGLRAFQTESHFIFYRFNKEELTILRVLHKTRLFSQHL